MSYGYCTFWGKDAVHLTISVLVPDIDVSIFQARTFFGVYITLELGN